MAHAQKPDFVFRPKGLDHLNRWVASVQSTTGSRGVRISGSNAGYTMFRGGVKCTGYPLHSPVSLYFPSRASPCAITFVLDYTTSTQGVAVRGEVRLQDHSKWRTLHTQRKASHHRRSESSATPLSEHYISQI